MKEVEDKLREHIESYTDQCIRVFTKFIKTYRNEKDKTEKRLECICEVFSFNSMSLTFIDFPDMSNYCQVLDDPDEAFMKNPEFLDKNFYDDFMSYLTKYIEENSINEDEHEAYEEITSPIIVSWLSRCWRAANQKNGTSYNLFYFEHRYFNQPAINLKNQEKVFLEDLAAQC